MHEKTINLDAFAHGQMASKLWLCDNFSKFFPRPEGKLVFLGAWYGTLPFLLLSRKQILPKQIVLVDVDANALEVAKKILEYWIIEGLNISFVHADALSIDYSSEIFQNTQILFNTSCEHMNGTKWFDNIPAQTYFVIQGTNMVHDEHIFRFDRLTDFENRFESSERLFSDKLTVHYDQTSFERYMTIGRKK